MALRLGDAVLAHKLLRIFHATLTFPQLVDLLVEPSSIPRLVGVEHLGEIVPQALGDDH